MLFKTLLFSIVTVAISLVSGSAFATSHNGIKVQNPSGYNNVSVTIFGPNIGKSAIKKWTTTLNSNETKVCKRQFCRNNASEAIVQIQIKKYGFRCVVNGSQDGIVKLLKFKFPTLDDSDPAAFQLFCHSYDNNGQLISEEPRGYGSNIRNVKFLATADPQPSQHEFPKNLTKGFFQSGYFLLKEYAESSDLRGIVIAGDLTQDAFIEERRCLQRYYYASDTRDGAARSDCHVADQQPFDPQLKSFKDKSLDISAGVARWVFDGMGNHDEGRGKIQPYKASTIKYMVGTKYRTVKQNMDATSDSFPYRWPQVRGQQFYGRPHYSWDWQDVHFVHLNVFPANENCSSCPPDASYIDPYDALSFLQKDLKLNVINDHSVQVSDRRPIVLVHHYGFNAPGLRDWSEQQRVDYWNTIKDYNVLAILVGHTHLGETESSPDGLVLQQFQRPANATGGPDFYNALNISAAVSGVYNEILINETELIMKRYFVGGNERESGQPTFLKNYRCDITQQNLPCQ